MTLTIIALIITVITLTVKTKELVKTIKKYRKLVAEAEARETRRQEIIAFNKMVDEKYGRAF